jgi:predicted flavoprotein YhiN
MATYNIYKETALPGTLQPHSIYLVAPAARPDFVEMYVTGTVATTVKRVIDQAQVQSMIDASVSGFSSLQVVANITARNALAPTSNIQVLVLDATGDSSVASGSATYVYVLANTAWVKISESESQDVVLQWTNIQNKPTSSVAAIDSAVSNSHTHANKTQLDKVGESGGQFTYNGAKPTIDWTSSGW